MTDVLGRTPVTIVTGFLGSGKTTLLNHMLTRGSGRVAALVNDFGAIDVDAALISSVSNDVIQLANGCICCTINSDLYAAAVRVLELAPKIDRIVVETTGLADPLPVGLTFLQTELRASTVLDAVITVVDSTNFALDLCKADAAMAQIVHGDIIVLNKADLSTESEILSLEARIAVLKPKARILRAVRGRLPQSVLVDQTNGAMALDPSRPRSHSHSAEDDGFKAYAFQFTPALSATRFQSWLDRGMPQGIFRGKGFVRFDTNPDTFVFQLCGGRSTFDRFESAAQATQLVFIGREIDSLRLEQDLLWCVLAPA